MQRDHVASTFIRRHFNVVCPLAHWAHQQRRTATEEPPWNGQYEGHAKSSVTNRLPWFYPCYILKKLHFTWIVCWIANDTPLFRANCFPTDRVISSWNRCSHIHWPIYLLLWNMDQAKDGQESTFYMTTPPLISVRLLSPFWLLKRWKF